MSAIRKLPVLFGVTLVLGCVAVATEILADVKDDSLAHRAEMLQVENNLLREKIDQLEIFSPHKPNYIQLYTVNPHADKQGFPSQDANVKFQISFKNNFLTTSLGRFFLGYTQKSFWLMYDVNHSSPFRETNYNPELYWQSPVVDWHGNWQLKLGGEHESNGMAGDQSRSWNRVYAIPRYTFFLSGSQAVITDVKIWSRLAERPKTSPTDSRGDDNPDILDYYGNAELTTLVKLQDLWMSAMGRWNPETGRGAFEIDCSFPLVILKGIFLHFQYWNGYGESLIDYNHAITRYGFGFMFTRTQ